MKKLTKEEIILALVVILLIISLGSLKAQTPRQAVKQYRDECYVRLNEIRAEHNLQPVKVNHLLEADSNQWLHRMLKRYNGKMRHEYSKGQSEVIAHCEDPIDCWMHSPGHKKILLDPSIKEFGLAIVDGYACMKGK